MQLEFPFNPPLNPAANGMALSLSARPARPCSRPRSPSGFYNTTTRQGWSSSAAGTSANWRSRATVNGISSIKLSWKDRRDPSLVSFQIKGRKMSIAMTPADLPLTARVRLDGPAALTGQCAALAFPGPPTGVGCVLTGGGASLICQ